MSLCRYEFTDWKGKSHSILFPEYTLLKPRSRNALLNGMTDDYSYPEKIMPGDVADCGRRHWSMQPNCGKVTVRDIENWLGHFGLEMGP